LTLFSLVIWGQSGIADFPFIDNITAEVSKDFRHIGFRVQSFPSWWVEFFHSCTVQWISRLVSPHVSANFILIQVSINEGFLLYWPLTK
jgi:hypothetical protein